MAQPYCLPKPRSHSLGYETFLLIIAVTVAYFMISAWDDVLDGFIQTYIVKGKGTLLNLVVRAIIATIVAVLVLNFIKLNLNDIFSVY